MLWCRRLHDGTNVLVNKGPQCQRNQQGENQPAARSHGSGEFNWKVHADLDTGDLGDVSRSNRNKTN